MAQRLQPLRPRLLVDRRRRSYAGSMVVCTVKSTSSPRPTSLLASKLIHACLDGEVPVARGSVQDVAGACGWMLARCAGALVAVARPKVLLGAALVLTRADCDRAGYARAPASPLGEPHPATTAVWLFEQEPPVPTSSSTRSWPSTSAWTCPGGQWSWPKPPVTLSLIHISEPTRRTPISYAVFC